MGRPAKRAPRGYESLPMSYEQAVAVDRMAWEIFSQARHGKSFDAALSCVLLTGMSWAVEMMQESSDEHP